jgi:hypothetical protein
MVEYVTVGWLAVAWGVAMTATLAVLVGELATQARRIEPRWSGTDIANAVIMTIFVMLLGINRGHYEEVAAAVYLALGTAFVTLRWHTVCRVRIRSPRGTGR